jgi:hypothetical protein
MSGEKLVAAGFGVRLPKYGLTTVGLLLVIIPKSDQKTIICHSERSEESRFLSRRDSSLRYAPFRMTWIFNVF